MAVKRVIADTTDEANKFSSVMGGIVQSSSQIKQDFNDILASAKAIKDATKGVTFPSANAANVAGTANQAQNSMNTFEPTPNASTIVAQTKDGARQTDYGQTGGNGGYTPGQGDDSYSGPNWKGYGGWSENPKTSGGSLKNAGKAVVLGAAGAISATATAIDTPTYITNEISRRRFGFLSGQYGKDYGGQTFEDLMSAGTASSSLDAADAAMAGASAGMLPGLKNYKGIMKSVAGVSNMLPGAGLTASMGAVGALNQASSVNKLRMIGIQVRDQKGYMRDVEAIAKDLWNMLNKSKTGGANITAEDLSYSLQSGMSLDSLLNQYFSGDPVLRESIVAYLYQFASGKSTSKANLKATGANPSISQSMSARMSSAYKTENFFTNAGIAGIEDANKGIIAVADNLRALNTTITENTVRTLAATEVFTGAGDGAMGQIITTGITAGGVALAGAGAKALSGLKNKFKGKKGLGSLIAGILAAGGLAASALTQTQNDIANTGNSDTSDGKYEDTSAATSGSDLINKNVHPENFVQQKDTQLGWASKVLEGIGAPVTENNLRAMVSWMHAESSSNNNYQTWNNPLNTTRTAPGSIPKNGVGVQEYVNEDQGVQATIETLKLDFYKSIIEDFKNNAAPSETLKDITSSKWGTNTINNVTINVDGSGSAAETAQTIADFLQNQR
jgi:hypothetical protein